MPLTDETRDQINEAIFAGRKIEAIKLYREATGQGLKESKDFIDEVTARLREEHPDKVPASTSGCAAVLMLVVALACGAGFWMTN